MGGRVQVQLADREAWWGGRRPLGGSAHGAGPAALPKLKAWSGSHPRRRRAPERSPGIPRGRINTGIQRAPVAELAADLHAVISGQHHVKHHSVIAELVACQRGVGAARKGETKAWLSRELSPLRGVGSSSFARVRGSGGEGILKDVRALCPLRPGQSTGLRVEAGGRGAGRRKADERHLRDLGKARAARRACTRAVGTQPALIPTKAAAAPVRWGQFTERGFMLLTVPPRHVLKMRSVMSPEALSRFSLIWPGPKPRKVGVIVEDEPRMPPLAAVAVWPRRYASICETPGRDALWQGH